MRTLGIYIGFLIIAALFTGCKPDSAIEEPNSQSPWYSYHPEHFPPALIPTDNQPTDARIQLGKSLFFDPVMSVDSSISCATCHDPNHAFANLSSTTPGVQGRPGTRNVPGIFNMAYQNRFLREGGLPTLEMQILVPIQEHNEFDFNIVELAERLSRISFYDSLSRLAYNRSPDAFVITRSISAFERALVSDDSFYDQVKKGQRNFDSELELGYSLFVSDKLNCVKCHTEPLFTNQEIKNNGLYLDYQDVGLSRLTKKESDIGKFKIPSLRNVALTPPYMHDGSLKNLEEVINHYKMGGRNHPNQDPLIKPFELNPAEQRALISFLESLSDSSFIKNTNYH